MRCFGSLDENAGEFLLAYQDGRAPDGMAELGDAPAAGAGDLRDEAAHVKAFDEARDLPAAPGVGGGRGTEQVHPPLAVVKAVQGVLPAEHGGEEGEVGGGRGIDGARQPAMVIPRRLHQAIEGPQGGSGIVDDGERIEVAVIGGCGHGGVPRQERRISGSGRADEGSREAGRGGVVRERRLIGGDLSTSASN